MISVCDSFYEQLKNETQRLVPNPMKTLLFLVIIPMCFLSILPVEAQEKDISQLIEELSNKDADTR